MITKFFIQSTLRLAVKPLWKKGVSVTELRALAEKGDAWLARAVSIPNAYLKDIGGVTVDFVGPALDKAPGVILYLHGGAFFLDMPAGYRHLAHELVKHCGFCVVGPKYRLAPEHPYPAGLDDCVQAYRWVVEQGFSGNNLVVMGDSAGGNLTLATLMRARDEGLPMPGCAVMFSPVTDLSGSGASWRYNEAADSIFTLDALPFVRQLYIPNTPDTDPGVSPLLGNWQGLPPLLFQATNKEMLLDDSLRAVDRARAAGVTAEATVWNDLPHVFQAIVRLKESKQALNEAFAFVRKMLNLEVAPAEPSKVVIDAEALLVWGRELLADQPFSDLIHPELVSLTPGACELRMDMLVSLLDHQGCAHDGVLAYLGGAACWLAGESLKFGSETELKAFSIDRIAPAKGERLVIRTTARKDDSGRIHSSGEICMIRDGVETCCAKVKASLPVPRVDAEM